MKKAVIYARYSSHGQTEQSIEGQLRICNEFAKKNNITIVETYIDRKKTGQNDSRPNFQRMLKDSFAKKWDYVIFYAIDRFARDDGDYGADKKLLRQNGIKMLSATEITGTNPDGSENLSGILSEGILVAVAKYYSRELSKKVKRGQKESIEKHNFLGGNVLYGYLVDNKKLTIHPEESAIVKDIFTMYASGKTIDEITTNLKDRNIKTKLGNYFKRTTIMTMLKNKRYIGFFKYGEYEIENYNPAIIDEELFNLCAEKMTRRKRSIEKMDNYGDYLLSGKLYCGDCKSLMYGESGTSRNGNTYYYYKCFNKKKRAGCTKKSIKKDYIEDLVMSITFDNLLNEDIILDLVNGAVETHNQEIKEDSELTLLKKQLADTEKYIQNLLNAIKHGIFSETTQQELERLELEKKTIKKSIAHKETKQPQMLEPEQVLMFLKNFATENILSQQDKLSIINLLIEMVVLWDDRVVVVFKNGDNSGKPLNIDTFIKEMCSKKSHPTPPKCPFSNTNIYFTKHYIIIEKEL